MISTYQAIRTQSLAGYPRRQEKCLDISASCAKMTRTHNQPKNFTVKWKDTSVRDITTGGTLSIDGTSIPGQATPRDFGTAEISSQLISGSKERPLLFTTVELTGICSPQKFYPQKLTLIQDDNSYLNSVSDHLGEIELQIWQIQHPSRAVITGSSDVRLKHKIHERSSKAAAHCIMWVMLWSFLIPFN